MDDSGSSSSVQTSPSAAAIRWLMDQKGTSPLAQTAPRNETAAPSGLSSSMLMQQKASIAIESQHRDELSYNLEHNGSSLTPQWRPPSWKVN